MLSKSGSAVHRTLATLLSAAMLASATAVTAARQSPPQNKPSGTQTPAPAPTPEQQEMRRLFVEGNQELDKANLAAAERSFQAGLDKAEAMKNDRYIAPFSRRLGDVYSDLGQYEKARTYYNRALTLFQKLGDSHNIGVAYSNLGLTYASMAQFKEAVDYYHRALNAYGQRDTAQDSAVCLNNMGVAYASLGELDRALDCYNRALNLYKTLNNQRDMAGALANLGNMYHRLGDYERALEVHLEAYALRKQLRPPQDIAASLTGLGIVYNSLGRYREALQCENDALDIKKALNSPPDVAATLTDLGLIYAGMGNFTEALKRHKEALAIWQTLGKPNDIATSFNNLGSVYVSMTQFDKALNCYNRALKGYEQGGSVQEITVIYNNLGDVYTRQHRYEKAQAAFHKAVQQFETLSEQVGDPDQVGALQNTFGLYAAYAALRLRQGRPAEALTLLERGRAQGLARQIAQSRVDYAALFSAADAARWREANAERMTAWNLLGAAEKRSARAMEQAKAVDNDKAATPLQKEDAAAETATAQHLHDLAKQRDETAERHLSILRNELRPRYPRFRRLRGTDPPTPAQLADLARRHPDTLYLQWAVTEQETLLLALGQKDGFKGFSIPIRAQKLNDMAQTWRDAIEAAGKLRSNIDSADEKRYADKVESEVQYARDLYHALFDPLAKAGLLAPNRYRRLVLVGDGPLLDLPLCALVTGAGSKSNRDSNANAGAARLLDRYAVSTAISFGVLTWAGQSESRADQPLFCVADTASTVPERFPTGLAESVAPTASVALSGGSDKVGSTVQRVTGSLLRGGFGPLEEAREEGRDVVGMFPGAEGLAGPLAREGVVRERMGHADLLHFAVHGSPISSNPLRSWLLLAEEDENSPFDGRLEGREIASMHLRARIATLSACESGRGLNRGGDGLIGMAWAFRAAGCPCVVAAQWKVDDAASHVLMTHFYGNLKAGQRKDEALQSAMQAVRREGKHQSPFWWAGFEVIGDTTPLFARTAAAGSDKATKALRQSDK